MPNRLLTAVVAGLVACASAALADGPASAAEPRTAGPSIIIVGGTPVQLRLARTTLPRPEAAAAAPKTDTHMLDLSTGLVDGRRVLGRPVAGVTAALGRPDFRLGGSEAYRIGWGTPTEFSIEVIFRHSGSALRSWSIVFRRRGLVADVRIGDLLNRPSPALEKQVSAKYGKAYKLVRVYACRTSGFCSGEFAQRNGLLHFTFGSERGKGTWVTLWTSA